MIRFIELRDEYGVQLADDGKVAQKWKNWISTPKGRPRAASRVHLDSAHKFGARQLLAKAGIR
jgi:hypothetical protein